MPDPAEILQNLYAAGFNLQTFERFPKAVGVIRGEVMVLLESTPQGFRMLGTPGWKIGEFMGVLTSKNGEKVFQYKSETVEATVERVAFVEQFRSDLEKVLAGKPS
jgi:hypothetical protein